MEKSRRCIYIYFGRKRNPNRIRTDVDRAHCICFCIFFLLDQGNLETHTNKTKEKARQGMLPSYKSTVSPIGQVRRLATPTATAGTPYMYAIAR